MPVRPLHDRLLVRPLDPEKVSKGGIFIPETAQQNAATEGIVVAVGPGKLRDDGTREEMAIGVGARVIFEKYAGVEVKIEGVSMKMLRLDAIVAVVETGDGF